MKEKSSPACAPCAIFSQFISVANAFAGSAVYLPTMLNIQVCVKYAHTTFIYY